MRRSIIMTTCLVVVALTLGAAAQSTIEVSQPVQVTSNSYYERGESICFDGTNYWLFYGRSASVTGWYQNGNPDVNDYEVHYKMASSVMNLPGAGAAKISGVGVTMNANGYLGETGAACLDGKVWAFATVDVGATCDLYGWYTTDSGTTWNEVGPIMSGLSDGQAHHDEIAFGGKIWVVEGSGNFTTQYSASPETNTWTAGPSVAGLTGGLVHFFVDGSELYLAIFSAGSNYIYQYVPGPPEQWVQVDSVATSGWDPTLYKIGSDYVFAQAPYTGEGGGRQYIVAWTAETLDGSFFDGGSVMVTEGRYGTNTWIEMWPIGFTDNSGTTYLFYSSERDQLTQEGTGNIWYVEVDWDPANAHYTYIKEAVDNASSGDTVAVAAGTYTEEVTLTPGNDLTLTGAGRDVVTWVAPGEGKCCVKGEMSGYAGSMNYEISGVTFNCRSDPAVTWGAGIQINRASSGPLSLSIHDCKFIEDRASGDDTHWATSMLLCHNRYAARDGSGNGAVRVYDNIDETWGGMTMSNSQAYDIFRNVFDGCSDAIYNGHGCPDVAGQTFGDHCIFCNVFTNASDALHPGGLTPAIDWQYYGAGGGTHLPSTITLNVFLNNDTAMRFVMDTAMAYPAHDISYNAFVGNGMAIRVSGGNAATLTVERNWWGTLEGGVIDDLVVGLVDYTPWLTTSQIHMAAGGARLVETQLADGGWAWWADGASSSSNIIGPTGMGLAKAYRATGDASMLAALGTGPGTVSDFLLAKTNNFSNQDGYLAAELDDIFGVTTHVDHLNANFYGPLAAGTYDKGGLGVLYSTATYVQSIRDLRESQGIPNLAAWDLGMALVAAASCGADTTEWIAGVKAEIDELDPDSGYETSGLGGAIYGLAFVGESYTAGGGGWCNGKNLNQLADLLVTFQVPETGGFAWDYLHVIPYEANESIQYTETAVKALNEIGGYHDEIVAAIEYISTHQLCTGGWRSYEDSNENNEVTAEAMWGWSKGNLLELNVDPADLYVKTNETGILIDMDVSNLLQMVKGCQAIINFSSTYFLAGAGEVVVAEGDPSGPWDELIWGVWDSGGDLDVCVGVWGDTSPGTGTDVDATVAKITLQTGSNEGTTQVVFRADVDDVESTWLADMNAQAVMPNKVDSLTIVIDGTAPDVEVTYPDGGEYFKGGTVETITWTATDTYIDSDSVVLEYSTDSGATWNPIASGQNNDGSYDWTVPLLDVNTARVQVTVSDLSGNSTSDESDADFTIDSTNPVVDDIQAIQGGGSDLTPSDAGNPAVQGAVVVSVYVSDDDTGVDSGIDWTQLPTITVTDSAANPLAAGAVTADSGNGRFQVTVTVAAGTANGVADIAVSGVKDKAGNEATATLDDTFYINKNQITGTVELEDLDPPAGGITRTVRFVATGGTEKTWDIGVVFPAASSTGTYTLTDVPDLTTGLSAKTAWNLRSKVAMALDGNGQATGVNFTGGDKLPGGDLNGTNTINILDYAILKLNWYTANDVADITGDGGVGLPDYSVMVRNWFARGDAK